MKQVFKKLSAGYMVATNGEFNKMKKKIKIIKTLNWNSIDFLTLQQFKTFQNINGIKKDTELFFFYCHFYHMVIGDHETAPILYIIVCKQLFINIIV